MEAFTEKIIIRSGQLIIAEHRRASQPDSAIVKPEHAAALWQLIAETSTGST